MACAPGSPATAWAGAGAPGSSAWPSWPSCPPASAWASWPSSCGALETSRPSTARTSASGSAGTAAASGARQSVFVKCWYDAVIAYQEGDPDKPRMSAAVALHAIYRAFFTYKGNFAYQMVHEMGDAWVAPIVQALINRGVKFHFFHRVWDLLPGRDAEGRPVLDGIVLERQVADTQGHDLFTTLKGGRKVWPRRPTFGGESRLDLAQLGLDDFYGHDSEIAGRCCGARTSTTWSAPSPRTPCPTRRPAASPPRRSGGPWSTTSTAPNRSACASGSPGSCSSWAGRSPSRSCRASPGRSAPGRTTARAWATRTFPPPTGPRPSPPCSDR